MLVTDDRLIAARDLLPLALAAERGGVTSVQVRLKKAPPRELAEVVRGLTRSLRIPVIVNDRPDVALATGAAGVHLGPEDVAPELVRRIAPAGFLIGASVGSEAEAAAAQPADYWGLGPWRATGTKADAGTALGLEGFTRLIRLAGQTPAIAIGGVTPDDVPIVVQNGGKGVAVVSGILAAGDVEAAARRYVDAGRRVSGAAGQR
jgi:thiamine-phosphate pyrophosphorylase